MDFKAKLGRCGTEGTVTSSFTVAGRSLHPVGTFHDAGLLHREVQGIIQCLTSIPLDSEAELVSPGDRALPFLPRLLAGRGRWIGGK